IFWPGKLAHSEPLGIKRNHPALRHVNAADLFIVRVLASGFVTVDVEDYGNFAGKIVWLIKQRRNPKSRQCFVSQFFDVITRSAFDSLQPFDLGFCIAPTDSLTAINDPLK